MPPGHVNLLLDQIEIVEEPLGRGGDLPRLRLIDGDGGPVEGAETLFVFVQPGEEPGGAAANDGLVPRRQGEGVSRQLFDAKQLGPQRGLAHARARTSASADRVLQAWQNLHDSYFFFRSLTAVRSIDPENVDAPGDSDFSSAQLGTMDRKDNRGVVPHDCW